ncbi:hypothetical protein K523DRAFT_325682 [Schizophyllum commune Tattone D]|nr:hypothetical protein K523DRAFT_325682 [Schizophyllum commune Tattone D]
MPQIPSVALFGTETFGDRDDQQRLAVAFGESARRASVLASQVCHARARCARQGR